jgi:AcrR family transcriptional regulator
MPGATALLRNEPVQARSTARLTSLLDAAAQVVDEIGFERLTTAMVAERAGASIGTVYRYFPDRIAVLQSLSARSLSQFLQRVRPALTEPVRANWWEAVNTVFDDAVNAFRSEPGFRSLRFGDVIDVHPSKDDRSGNSIMAEEIGSVLSSTYGLPAGDDLLLRLEVAITMADALLARAFAQDRTGDVKFIEEARAVVRSYLVGHYGEPKAA